MQGVKYVQSQQKRHGNDIFDVTLFFIFKRFHKERKKTKCFNIHRTLYILKLLGKIKG